MPMLCGTVLSEIREYLIYLVFFRLGVVGLAGLLFAAGLTVGLALGALATRGRP